MSFLHDGFIARLLYVLESYAGKVTLQFDRLDLPPPAGWQGKMQKLAGAALTACSRAEQGPLQHLESCRTFATRYTQPYFLLLDKPIWYLITVLPYDNLCRGLPCHSAVLAFATRRDEPPETFPCLALQRPPASIFSIDLNPPCPNYFIYKMPETLHRVPSLAALRDKLSCAPFTSHSPPGA